jgi:hypothetical protein
MAERDDHDQGIVSAVLSEHATVARWAGDSERDKEYHHYIDMDVYDSAEKYHAARYDALAADNAALRAQLAEAQAQVQTARDALREAIALCDWDTSDCELFALENKLRALIQPTTDRRDAAMEE